MNKSLDLSQQCPLLDPEIGIISETDHRVGLCLCEFCICGKHICPSRSPRKSVKYRSNYRADFSRKSFDIPIKSVQPEFKRNSFEMDLQTTHNSDFLPYTIQPSASRPVQQPAKQSKMNANSGYRLDFPNWGPRKITHEKQWHPPLRSSEITFSGHSTYRHDFRSSKPQDKKITSHKDNFIFSNKDIVGPGTTYTLAMKDYSRASVNSRVDRRVERYVKYTSPSNHFCTIATSSYKLMNPNNKDPRFLKKSLKSNK